MKEQRGLSRRLRDKKKKKKASIRAGIREVMLRMGVATTLQDWSGFTAENKMEDSLRYFRKKKIIKEYRRTRRFDQEDQEGKDFIVELLNSKEVAIDVKNHRWYQVDEEKRRKKGIYLLTIWPNDTKEIAREKVLALIISAYLSGQGIETVRAIISTTIQGIEMPEPPKVVFIRRLAFLREQLGRKRLRND